MLREYVTSLPVSVGVVPWPSELGRVTIIVKLRLVVAPTGELVPAGAVDVEALSLDVASDRGELSYASDFAPYKPSCDFFVGGRDAADHAGGGHLSVGAVERRCRDRESLGPRANFCRAGDPTEPSSVRAWSTGRVDFSRFQSVPPAQRLPFPRAPFQVRYMRSGARLAGRYVGPEPRVRLVDPALGGAATDVPVALDTIVIRPDQAGVTLVFRGIGAPRTWNETVVVDRGEGLDVARAPRFRLVDPSMAAAANEPLAASTALPVAALGAPPRETLMTSGPSMSVPAALPFRAADAPASREPQPAFTPRQFAELREAGRVAHAFEAREGTAVAPQADLRSEAQREPAPVPRAAVAPPLPVPPREAPVEHGSADGAGSDGELEAKLGEIQKEVWKGERPVAEILASYGMTELEWRAAKRARSGRR